MCLGDLGEVENTNGRDVVDYSFFHRIARCEFNDPRNTDRSSCTDRDGKCVCADVRMGGRVLSGQLANDEPNRCMCGTHGHSDAVIA
jgi:hypothetical protein